MNRMKIQILILTALLLGACAKTPEPRVFDTIVIQNSTGGMVRSLTLSTAVTDSGTRVGSVSPVPVGMPHRFERPDHAKRLPEQLLARWIDTSGRTFSTMLDISKAQASPTQRKRLTIELLPEGRYALHAE